MFDIGFWELVLISVVGLVVLGPERLPVAIRHVSRFIHSAKAMASSVKDELSEELKIKELQDNLRKAEQMGMEDLSPELKASVEELKQAARDVQRPYGASNLSISSQAQEDDPIATSDVEAMADLEQFDASVKLDDELAGEPTVDPTATTKR